jgi:hypothetical protein
MRAFPCACGAGGCRGVVRGSDHLEPFVERYGDHVSDHVRKKREEVGVAAGVGEAGVRQPRPRRRAGIRG